MKRIPLIAAVVLCGTAWLGRADASETVPPAAASSERLSAHPISDASWFALSLHEAALPHKNTQGLARLFTVRVAPRRKSENLFDFKPEVQVSPSWKLSFSWTGDMLVRDPHAAAVAAYGRPW